MVAYFHAAVSMHTTTTWTLHSIPLLADHLVSFHSLAGSHASQHLDRAAKQVVASIH